MEQLKNLNKRKQAGCSSVHASVEELIFAFITIPGQQDISLSMYHPIIGPNKERR